MLLAADLQIGISASAPWHSAVSAYRDGGLVLEADDAPHWRAAGLLLPDGSVPDGWRDALETVGRPVAGGVVLARFGGTIFRTLLSVTSTHAVTVLSRSVLHPVTQGSLRPLPEVEVSVGPVESLWPLLRRVLPPVELLRAAPNPAAARVVDFSPPADWLHPPSPSQLAFHLAELENTHPALTVAGRAVAEVTTVLGRGVKRDSRQAHWYTDGKSTYRATSVELAEVGAGDVAQWHVEQVDLLVRRA